MFEISASRLKLALIDSVLFRSALHPAFLKFLDSLMAQQKLTNNNWSDVLVGIKKEEKKTTRVNQ